MEGRYHPKTVTNEKPMLHRYGVMLSQTEAEATVCCGEVDGCLILCG